MLLRFLYCLLSSLLLCIGAYGQKKTKDLEKKSGVASYYHSKFDGRKTATGDVFDNDLLTGASNYFSLGSYVKVTNKANGKSVVIKINDRMGGSTKRIVDVTQKAAEYLCFKNGGLCKVSVEKTTDTLDAALIIPYSSEEEFENEAEISK